MLNYFCETGLKFPLVIFWYIYTRLPSVLLKSSSLEFGCLFLSRWSHTASIIFRSGLSGGQSMTVGVLSAVFLTIYDFTELAVCSNQELSKKIAWWIKTCIFFSIHYRHQFGQYRQHHWQKCSPKPKQTHHHVSLKAASTHSSISLQLFFSHSRRLDTQILNLDSSLHNTLFHWSSFQSLWALWSQRRNSEKLLSRQWVEVAEAWKETQKWWKPSEKSSSRPL